MEAIGLLILIILCLVGFFAIFFTTFGTLLILLGALFYAAMTQFAVLNLQTLLVLLTLYLCGEVVEYFCIIFGAKKFGASNAGVVGAILGGILGAMFGASVFGVGLFVGALLGVFMGAFVVEMLIHRDVLKSIKAGVGSVLGKFGSIVLKVIIAMFMFGVIVLRILGKG